MNLPDATDAKVPKNCNKFVTVGALEHLKNVYDQVAKTGDLL